MDRRSAQLGLAGHREELLAIDADHKNICKFASEEGDYEQVEGEIIRLVTEAVTAAAERRQSPSSMSRVDEESRRSSTSTFFNSPLLFFGRPGGTPSSDEMAVHKSRICE